MSFRTPCDREDAITYPRLPLLAYYNVTPQCPAIEGPSKLGVAPPAASNISTFDWNCIDPVGAVGVNDFTHVIIPLRVFLLPYGGDTLLLAVAPSNREGVQKYTRHFPLLSIPVQECINRLSAPFDPSHSASTLSVVTGALARSQCVKHICTHTGCAQSIFPSSLPLRLSFLRQQLPFANAFPDTPPFITRKPVMRTYVHGFPYKRLIYGLSSGSCGSYLSDSGFVRVIHNINQENIPHSRIIIDRRYEPSCE